MSFFSQGSHYYEVRGEEIATAYEAGLKEARIRNLFPSVTTVNGDVRRSRGLELWKEGLLVDTVMAHPQVPEESVEEYKKRIGALVRKPASTAADFGSELHEALEHFPQLPLNPTLHPWIDQYSVWHTANVDRIIGNEILVAHNGIAVAGKTDLVCVLKDGRTAIVDYKTTEFKPGKTGKKLFYESWAWQLAFYAEAYRLKAGLEERPTCISLAINSKFAEPPIAKEWTAQEINVAWNVFVLHAWLWQEKEGHWPVGQWSPVEFWAL